MNRTLVWIIRAAEVILVWAFSVVTESPAVGLVFGALLGLVWAFNDLPEDKAK